MSISKTIPGKSTTITTKGDPTIYYQYGTENNYGKWFGGNFYGGTFKGFWYDGNYYNSNWEGQKCLNSKCTIYTNIPPTIKSGNQSRTEATTKNQHLPWDNAFVKKDTEKL